MEKWQKNLRRKGKKNIHVKRQSIMWKQFISIQEKFNSAKLVTNGVTIRGNKWLNKSKD